MEAENAKLQSHHYTSFSGETLEENDHMFI